MLVEQCEPYKKRKQEAASLNFEVDYVIESFCLQDVIREVLCTLSTL